MLNYIKKITGKKYNKKVKNNNITIVIKMQKIK